MHGRAQGTATVTPLIWIPNLDIFQGLIPGLRVSFKLILGAFTSFGPFWNTPKCVPPTAELQLHWEMYNDISLELT